MVVTMCRTETMTGQTIVIDFLAAFSTDIVDNEWSGVWGDGEGRVSGGRPGRGTLANTG